MLPNVAEDERGAARRGRDVTSTGTLARRLGARDAVVIGLGSMIGAGVFPAFGPALPGPDPRLRVELAGAHLVGLAISRFIVKVEPLASVDEETIVARVAPAIQGYLTGAVAEAKAPRATPPARPRAAAR